MAWYLSATRLLLSVRLPRLLLIGRLTRLRVRRLTRQLAAGLGRRGLAGGVPAAVGLVLRTDGVEVVVLGAGAGGLLLGGVLGRR
ncbi:hypothetical protein GCM10009789_23430 [Kribbella sancticallisti]|uniref:Uncharacterized protein n=1 Tax=Kribbella sancticallisti TaxID=460087 RepID=A0ABN2D586_9ACTN